MMTIALLLGGATMSNSSHNNHGNGDRSLSVLLLVLTAVLACAVGEDSWSHGNADFQSPFSWCESTHKPRPFTGPAPALPRLPEQYSLKVEANILEKDWTTELEEHYDRPNQRASLALTFNGTTTRTIFNFKAGEKYDIYPNSTCGTRPGQIDFFGYLSRNKNKKGGKPVMATVNDMLRLGSDFQRTYVGQTSVRGIRVNHWTSCQQWQQVGARFQLDYYFAHPDYQPATGQATTQMPIRIVLNGTAGNINMMNKPLKGSHTFYHIYDFTSIRIGLPRDLTVFEIPPGIVCHGRSDHKTMPQLPEVFQMSMETVLLESQVPPKHQLMLYDYEHRLVETRTSDMKPVGGPKVKGQSASQGQGHIGNPSSSSSSLDPDDFVEVKTSVIEDYNTGLRYVVNTNTFKCSIERMDSSGDGGTPVMAHGEALLKMAHGQEARTMDFSYQGVSTLRNMKVEVWGSESNGITQQIFFMADPDVEQSAKKPLPGGGAATGQGDRVAGSSNRPNDGQSSWPDRDWSGNGQQRNPNQERAGGFKTDETTTSTTSGGNTANKWPVRPKPGDGSPKENNDNNNNNWDMGHRGGQHSGGQTSTNTEGTTPSTTTNYARNTSPLLSGRRSVKRRNNQPAIVGLFFRNKTATDERRGDMSAFFGQVINDKSMKWAEELARRRKEEEKRNGNGKSGKSDNSSSSSSSSPDISDQISWGMAMERSMWNQHGEVLVNVYDFKATHSQFDHFQASTCYEPEQTCQVLLVVKTTYQQNVLNKLTGFVNALRRAVATAVGVSVLSVSNMVATPLKNKSFGVDATAVTFTLLGSTPLIQIKEVGGTAGGKGKGGVGGGARATMHGLPIEEGKVRLTQAIANGIAFKVNGLKSSRTFMVDKLLYTLDYTRVGFMGASTSDASNDGAGDNDNDGGKYSSGTVAGIALTTMLLGGAVTMMVMGLLYKRRHHDFPMVPYNRDV